MATKKFEKVIEAKTFTLPEIHAGIRKIAKRIDEVKRLSETKVSYKDPKVKTAETNIRETVREVFGQNSCRGSR